MLVLLLLCEVFVSMIHSVVMMYWSMVPGPHWIMPISHWGCVMMELVRIICHGTKEAIILLTVALLLLKLLQESVGFKLLISLDGIDNAS